MSCQRTQQIDLLEFLANPRAGEFDAFRKHYPVCPECASEVRVWTELHQQLAASEPHPAPDLLLRFEDDPAGLPAERRSAVERHVASCVPCRDELRALRAFDPSAALAPAAPAGSKLSAAVTWLRRLLWHPALAYALVLILLTPILIETWGEATSPRPYATATPVDGKLARLQEAAKPSAAEPAYSGREAAARDIPLEDKRASELGLASRVEKQNQPAASTAPNEKLEERVATPKADRARAVGEPVARSKGRFAKRAEVDALDTVAPLAQAEEALQEQRQLEELRSDEDAQGALAGARATAGGDTLQAPPELKLMRRSAGSLERKLGAKDSAASGLTAFVERELPVVREGELLRLAIPTPTLAEGQDELDVQVVHANGRRRLRELVPADPSQPVTVLRIPAALFETGIHAAIVRVPGDPPNAIRHFDYTFRVLGDGP